jgi:hypothetical protein
MKRNGAIGLRRIMEKLTQEVVIGSLKTQMMLVVILRRIINPWKQQEKLLFRAPAII